MDNEARSTFAKLGEAAYFSLAVNAQWLPGGKSRKKHPEHGKSEFFCPERL